MEAGREAPIAATQARFGKLSHSLPHMCNIDATPWRRRLAATSRWGDPRSDARYALVVAHEEWKRVEKPVSY